MFNSHIGPICHDMNLHCTLWHSVIPQFWRPWSILFRLQRISSIFHEFHPQLGHQAVDLSFLISSSASYTTLQNHPREATLSQNMPNPSSCFCYPCSTLLLSHTVSFAQVIVWVLNSEQLVHLHSNKFLCNTANWEIQLNSCSSNLNASYSHSLHWTLQVLRISCGSDSWQFRFT